MNKKKLTALLLTSVIALETTGCNPFKSLGNKYDFSKTTVEISRQERKKEDHMGKKGTWTVFVYLCGSTLESGNGAASKDMEEMIASSANDKVQFVVETGGSSKWYNDVSSTKNQRYVIKNGEAELVNEVDASDMGDSSTLSDFLNWGVENYPAYNMGLVMWDHGGGCIYGSCMDETAENDQLYLKEMDAALYDVYDNMTDKFEFIGFDACLMSTIETAAVLATHSDYMIASEETESGTGWDYTALGNYLSENPKSDGEEVGKEICDSFYNSLDTDFQSNATMSVVDLSKIDTLIEGFDIFSQDLYNAIDTDSGFTEIARTIYSGDRFGKSGLSSYNLIDMGQLVTAGTDATEISTDVYSALNDAVVYKVNGLEHENACGLSIYYPLSVLNACNEIDIFNDVCVSPYYLSFVYDSLCKELGKTVDAIEDILSYFSNNYSGGYGSNYEYTASNNDIWDIVDSYDSNGNSNLIEYDEEPQLDSNGHYTFTLTSDSLDVTDHVEANIYTWNETESNLFELGYSGEVNADYATGIFSDKFDGNWFFLPDGQMLSAYFVDSTNDVSTYSSPVLLNGEETNIRFTYNSTNNAVTLLNVWGGIDENGGASRITELQKGDKITPIYHSYSKYSEEIEDYVGKEYTYTGDNKLKYQKLDAGEYWYSFDVYDIYGNYKETDPIKFNVADDEIEFTNEMHKWKEATCTEPKTCTICGATEGEALGHKWTEATCTEPKTCSVCSKSEGEALGHDWEDATYTAPKTCKRCGETEGDKLDASSIDAADLIGLTKNEFVEKFDGYSNGYEIEFETTSYSSDLFDKEVGISQNSDLIWMVIINSGNVLNGFNIGMTYSQMVSCLGEPNSFGGDAMDGEGLNAYYYYYQYNGYHLEIRYGYSDEIQSWCDEGKISKISSDEGGKFDVIDTSIVAKMAYVYKVNN